MARPQVSGNTAGLTASERRLAERVYSRRVAPTEIISVDLATELVKITRETRRLVGILIDRRGYPKHVILGDAHRVWLPDVGRLRAGRGRLRGLRLVRTSLTTEGVSRDDLTDLALLKLDLVAVISPGAKSGGGNISLAHLTDQGDKPWVNIPAIPLSELDLNPLDLVESLESAFSKKSQAIAAADDRDRAVIVHLNRRGDSRDEISQLAELEELCKTASLKVLDVITQTRIRADPRYAIGRGKLEEVLLRATQLEATLLIFNPDLSAAQARAIGEATEMRVIDRTILILDIFAQHARSQSGKVQVEIAQLRYMLPRLVAKNTMMSRLAGGIGGRGPGETKLEINRRRARERVTYLSKKVEEAGRQRARQRERRKRRGTPVVSIVGYTNAGKSTLLNTLTQADAEAADKLFATLSPLHRRLRFPREREVILTDTVGFIHDLPKELMAAFRATIEELTEADILIHVVDVANPEYEDQIRTVRSIVNELSKESIPTILAFNKADKIGRRLARSRADTYQAIPISAIERQTTVPLLTRVEKLLWPNQTKNALPPPRT